MKQVILFTLMVLFLSISSYTQEKEGENKNSLVAGKWALQFQIINNFQISGFQGGLLSAKKHLTSNSAIRLGFGLGTQISNWEHSSTYIPTDSVYYTTSTDYHSYNIQIRSQYLYYISPESDINLFFCVGPEFNYLWSKYDYISGGFQKNNYTSIGISGGLGVEWFVNKSISFTAEYNGSADYYWEKVIRTSDNIIDDNKAKYFRFSSAHTCLGISLYF